MEIKDKIKNFIDANLIVFDEETDFSDNDNIFELGFVNSLFAMKLLSYLESEFNILIENEDMDINNFNSVSNIMKFMSKKLS